MLVASASPSKGMPAQARTGSKKRSFSFSSSWPCWSLSWLEPEPLTLSLSLSPEPSDPSGGEGTAGLTRLAL